VAPNCRPLPCRAPSGSAVPWSARDVLGGGSDFPARAGSGTTILHMFAAGAPSMLGLVPGGVIAMLQRPGFAGYSGSPRSDLSRSRTSKLLESSVCTPEGRKPQKAFFIISAN
jgi:hypothetical protein